MGGRGVQRCQPVVELVIVDLAAGEPLGQDLLGAAGRPGAGPGWL
jgi:hypothetical protein